MQLKSFCYFSTVMFSSIFISACHKDSKQSLTSWKNQQQMMLVLSKDWNANKGSLLRFQYKNHQWFSVGQPIAVSLGKKGSAWEWGYSSFLSSKLMKREGDMRSPAGVFGLGKSFGYDDAINITYPHQALTANDYCIDNSQSTYYNKIVDRRKVGEDEVKKSTEPMRRDIHLNGDQLYKLGFIIKYNSDRVAKAGSCIFVHLRMNANATTAGCTAMDEKDMKTILNWLDTRNQPVFVLLPMQAYHEKKYLWNLPKIQTNLIKNED